MDELRYIQVKKQNNEYSQYIPIATDAIYITMQNEIDLQSTIGDINSDLEGSITENLRKFNQFLSNPILQEDSIKAAVEKIQHLDLNSVFMKYLKSDLVVAHSIEAASARFAETATVALTAERIDADNIDVDNLTADSALMKYLQSNLIVAAQIQVDDLKAKLAQIDTLEADSAFMRYLQANLIVASEIQVDDLKAKLAQIDTLTAGSAFVNYLQSLSSTTAQSTITDAYIYNAVAGKITVADLAAGDIVLGNQMRILTNSGATEGMIMSGSELQFLDGNGNPSISIGYNTISDGQGGTTVDYDHPAIVIKDSNGSVMLNSSGLSQGDIGLAPMIQTSSISKSQLNFPIVDTDEHGNISITNINDGSGNNFGVEYVSFKNNTSEALDALDEKIEESATYRLDIFAPNGRNIHGGNITLQAKLFKNSVDVTDEYDASCFVWKRYSKDSYGDTYWNQNHTTGTKILTLTGNDINITADFGCEFNYDDLTVTSS